MTEMITEPGIYDLPMADYLADPCPVASFSASAGKALLQMSPRHAWLAHPKLGNASDEPPNAKADFGSVVHELVLGCGSQFRVLDVTDFRTKAAQEARDEAIEDGLTPIKVADFVRAEAAAASIRAQLPDVFAEGYAERTIIWRDGPTWCRARPDWLVQSEHAILDLKITGINISPLENAVQRHIFAMWYDLTAAHYMDGYLQLFGEEPVYWFLFVENCPPFSIRPFRLSGQGVEMGKRKLVAARSWWKSCMETGKWPGIGVDWNNVADPEPWQATGWLTYDAGLPSPGFEAAMEMNRPLEDAAE